jgi:hypothetical protein
MDSLSDPHREKLPPVVEQGTGVLLHAFLAFHSSLLTKRDRPEISPDAGRSQKDLPQRRKEPLCSKYIFLGDQAAGRRP